MVIDIAQALGVTVGYTFWYLLSISTAAEIVAASSLVACKINVSMLNAQQFFIDFVSLATRSERGYFHIRLLGCHSLPQFFVSAGIWRIGVFFRHAEIFTCHWVDLRRLTC